MSTLNEIVYSVREAYRLYSDDGAISNEYIAYKIETTRAMLISQRFSSRSFIIPNILRQHFYMSLELSDDNEFISGNGSILRTVDPIQIPLEPFNFSKNIRITSGSYSDVSFTFVDNNRFSFVGRSKWVQNQIYVTLGTDFRLYFTSNNPKVKMIDKIKLSMVTAIPEAAYPSSVAYDPAIPFEDTQYPLNAELIVELTDIVLKQLTTNLQVKEDKTNDAQND